MWGLWVGPHACQASLLVPTSTVRSHGNRVELMENIIFFDESYSKLGGKFTRQSRQYREQHGLCSAEVKRVWVFGVGNKGRLSRAHTLGKAEDIPEIPQTLKPPSNTG